MARMRRAKIVATVGPASESPERLRELIAAGVDVVRVNMSHGTREHHAEVIHRAHEIAADLKRPVSVMADLGGPKIRTGKLAGGGPIELEDGATIRLVTDEVEGTAEAVSVSYPRLAEEVKPGDRVLIDDGMIELQVESLEPGRVVARVVHGGPLNERKGVNLPGVALSIPSITEKDHADLAAALEAGVEYVALSFVRKAADCEQAAALIETYNSSAMLVAKIEKPAAMENLDAIVEAADGVMVARGDLGVETSPESVPIYQKQIIAKARDAGKFVITATQMLQSMIEQPRPTRAEASDVANAILDGTDAVMLSGETAVGKFPIETVQTMERIVSFTEKSRPIDRTFVARMLGQETGSFRRAIAEAALLAAQEIRAQTIVVFTQGGKMARQIATLRPRQRIVALTSSGPTYRQLSAVWGVEPFRVDFGWSPGSLMMQADRALLEYGIAEKGETIIYMAGRIAGMPLSTMMKLHTVGDGF
jgi:pyruvate kinase